MLRNLLIGLAMGAAIGLALFGPALAQSLGCE